MLIVVGMVVSGYLLLFREETKLQTEITVNEVLPSPVDMNDEPKAKEVTVGEKKYNFAIIKNVSAQQIKLIPNYEKQLSTEEMLQTENCEFVINGGFYGTDYRPLGWVEISGEEISRQKSSSLFNGFAYISNDYVATISAEKPETSVLYGLQTGPLLVQEQKAVLLSSGGKNARRMVMATDTDGRLIFLSFFVTGMWTQSGPTLDELPEFVLKVAKLENVSINNAVNLDGGSASTFKGPDILLSEISPVGSWWCIK